MVNDVFVAAFWVAGFSHEFFPSHGGKGSPLFLLRFHDPLVALCPTFASIRSPMDGCSDSTFGWIFAVSFCTVGRFAKSESTVGLCGEQERPNDRIFTT